MWCLIDLQNDYKGILFDDQKSAYEYGKKYLNRFRVIPVYPIAEYMD